MMLAPLIYVAILTAALSSWESLAQVELPPELSPEKYLEFANQLVADNPWMAQLLVANQLPGVANAQGMVKLDQELVKALRTNEMFLALQKHKKPLSDIMIGKSDTEPVARTDQVFKDEVFEEFRDQLLAELANAPNGDQVLSSLHQALFEQIDLAIIRPLPSMIQGIAACLPPPDRKSLFTAGGPSEQIAFLQGLDSFNDSALAAKFKPDVFAMDGESIERNMLLHELDLANNRHSRIVRLLYLIALVGEDPKFSRDALERLRKDALLFKRQYWRALQDQLLESWEESTKLVTKKKFLAAEIIKKALADFEFLIPLQSETEKIEPHWILREVPPYLGIYRGCVGLHCATSQSWVYPYSPMEYVFYVFDGQKNLLGYASFTLVQIGGEFAIYLHDVIGPKIPVQLALKIISAIDAKKAYWGATKLVVPTSAQAAQFNFPEVAAWRDKELLKLSYLDGPLREFMKKAARLTRNIDDANMNHSAHLFIGDNAQIALRDFVVQVQPQGENEAPVIEETESLSDQFLRQLSLAFDNPDVRAEGLSQDVVLAAQLLKNADGKTLTEYYTPLAKIFAAHDINLSANFIKKYEHWFRAGHLAAEDAASTAIETLHTRTVRFVVNTLKFGTDKRSAWKVLEAQPKRITDHSLFVSYVNDFNGGRHEDQEIFEGFERIGIALPETKLTIDQIRKLTASPVPAIKIWAVEILLKKFGPDVVDQDLLANIATLLDNHQEKLHPTETICERALTILEKFPSSLAIVNKELYRTATDDDNVAISLRAAALFLQNAKLAGIDEKIFSERRIAKLSNLLRAQAGLGPDQLLIMGKPTGKCTSVFAAGENP